MLAIAMAYRLGSRLAAGRPALIAGARAAARRRLHRRRSGAATRRACSSRLPVGGRAPPRRPPPDAFLLGFAAALLRPEVWPFFGLYGLWLGWIEPRRRVLVGASFAACGFLWFAPEYWARATGCAPATARTSRTPTRRVRRLPFLEVFKRSASILSPPVLLGGLIALVRPIRARGGTALLARARLHRR
jgi:hypothetical protein